MIGATWTWLWAKSVRRQLVAGVVLVYVVMMSLFVVLLISQQRAFLQLYGAWVSCGRESANDERIAFGNLGEVASMKRLLSAIGPQLSLILGQVE